MSSVIGTALGVVQPILLALVVVVLVLLAVNSPLALVLFAILIIYSLQPLPAQNFADLGFYQTCTNHSTLASCRQSASGSCDGIYETFQNDPEWAAYRKRLCDPTLRSASLNRLSTSYNPTQCAYGDCDAACTSELSRIQLEMLAYGCPPGSASTGIETLVDPGEVLTLSPLYGPTFRVVGWVGLGLVLVVLAFKAGRYIVSRGGG